MRVLLLSGIVAITAAGAVPYQKRQLLSLPLDPWKDIITAPALSPSSTKDLKATYFPQATRQKILWGPFTLQAANGTHKGSGINSGADGITKSLAGLWSNCMLLKADYELASRDGKRFEIRDGIYIHHIIVADTTQTGPSLPAIPVCPLGGLPKLVGGAGSQTVRMSGMAHGHSTRITYDGPTSEAALKAAAKVYGAVMIAKGHENGPSLYAAANSSIKSGFFLGSQDTIGANIEAINYKNTKQDVYLSIDFEYVETKAEKSRDYLRIGDGTITSGAYPGKGMDLPDSPKDKAISYKSEDWTATFDEYFLNISPHLHNGALNLKFFVNNKIACSSTAIYGGDGAEVSIGMPTAHSSSGTVCDRSSYASMLPRTTMF